MMATSLVPIKNDSYSYSSTAPAATPTTPRTPRNPWRLLEAVPADLRVDLVALLTSWGRNADSATDTVKRLRARLEYDLRGPLLDESKRTSLKALVTLLRKHKQAALELARVAAEAQS